MREINDNGISVSRTFILSSNPSEPSGVYFEYNNVKGKIKYILVLNPVTSIPNEKMLKHTFSFLREIGSDIVKIDILDPSFDDVLPEDILNVIDELGFMVHCKEFQSLYRGKNGRIYSKFLNKLVNLKVTCSVDEPMSIRVEYNKPEDFRYALFVSKRARVRKLSVDLTDDKCIDFLGLITTTPSIRKLKLNLINCKEGAVCSIIDTFKAVSLDSITIYNLIFTNKVVISIISFLSNFSLEKLCFRKCISVTEASIFKEMFIIMSQRVRKLEIMNIPGSDEILGNSNCVVERFMCGSLPKESCWRNAWSNFSRRKFKGVKTLVSGYVHGGRRSLFFERSVGIGVLGMMCSFLMKPS